MRDHFYSPQTINIPLGASVTWRNDGGTSHTITADDSSFESGTILLGGTYTRTFYTSGTFRYYCRFHGSPGSGMWGTVVVGGGSTAGNLITLSNNNLNLTAGQSASVFVNNFSSGLYLGTNTNPNVATVSLLGSTITVQAINQGVTTIYVCQTSPAVCVNLIVNVSGYSGGSGNLTFQNTSLPIITLGQYYNYQLQVYGGQAPYNFVVSNGSLPNGLILSSSGQIYGTVNNAQNANFTVRVNDNYGRSGSMNFVLNTPSVLGTSAYKNGQLIKEGGTIYIVYRNQKSGFANLPAFQGFGFKLSNVMDISNSGLSNSGFVITTSNASHPWGSWVKSGQTVYFVHESGLVPVPDWNTFLNNNGQAHLIVDANIKDFALPILSPMVWSDGRLN
jgi:hypothetical protein